jgi:plastocyanin
MKAGPHQEDDEDMQSRTHIAVPAVLAATGLALLASGCGSDSKDSKASAPKPQEKTTAAAKAPASAGKGTTLALAADPGGKIAFDKKSLATKAGTTTIDFQNASQVPHAVEVEGSGVEKETKTIQGGKASLTLKLKPGSYEFYCPVDDHKGEGMKGTLTVK